MSSRIPGHPVCNALCSGNEHSDVVWHSLDSDQAKLGITFDWCAAQSLHGFELIEVRRVEAGPPTPEQAALRWHVGILPPDRWPSLFAWGVRWRELDDREWSELSAIASAVPA